MSPKKREKKRNKTDPIIQLAEKNRKKSLDVAQDAKNTTIIKKSRAQRSEEEVNRNTESNRFFNEMKKREF